MDRRSFITGLGGILAAAAAPAIVRADSLMRVVARDTVVFQRLDPFDIYLDPAATGLDETATAILRNGRIGMIDQFTVYQPGIVDQLRHRRAQRTANGIARLIADRLQMAANPALVVTPLHKQLEDHLRDEEFRAARIWSLPDADLT